MIGCLKPAGFYSAVRGSLGMHHRKLWINDLYNESNLHLFKWHQNQWPLWLGRYIVHSHLHLLWVIVGHWSHTDNIHGIVLCTYIIEVAFHVSLSICPFVCLQEAFTLEKYVEKLAQLNPDTGLGPLSKSKSKPFEPQVLCLNRMEKCVTWLVGCTYCTGEIVDTHLLVINCSIMSNHALNHKIVGWCHWFSPLDHIHGIGPKIS